MIDRVSGRRSFVRLRSEGRHLRAGLLSCTMIVDTTLPRPQVGYALGRSFGSAVERNRLRRRLRALVKGLAGEFPPGVYVFGASPKAKAASQDELVASLQGLARKVAGSPAGSRAGGRR